MNTQRKTERASHPSGFRVHPDAWELPSNSPNAFPNLKPETWNLKLQRGFTLIELLVVLAIIGILAALLMSGLARAKERAIRIKCLSNIKQLDLGLINYALDNKDRFPTLLVPEPSDIPMFVTGILRTYGVVREIMYDPGFPQWNTDTNWNDPSDGGTNREIGYVVALPGAQLVPGNENSTIIPQPVLIGANTFLPAPDPSRRVLVGGKVISAFAENNADPAVRVTYNYTRIADEYGQMKMRSPHLLGTMPSGDNEGMLDGSGTWRKFNAMMPRTLPSAPLTVWW